jgi:hypothetical protein
MPPADRPDRPVALIALVALIAATALTPLSTTMQELHPIGHDMQRLAADLAIAGLP